MPRLRTAVLAPIATVAALFLAPAAAQAELAVGVAASGPNFDVVSFDTATPDRFASVPLTGLGAGFAPVALDVRPSNGGIYVLGLNVQGGANDDIGQLYVVNPVTGAATAVGTPFASNLAPSPDWGFDFNPTSDTIRVVDGNGLNLRVNPETGAGASDGPITGSNDLRAVAYDRNTTSGTGTTLYGISAANGLVTISLSTFATTTVGGGPYAATTSFDISGASSTAFVASGTALQTINLATGAAAAAGTLQSALVGFSIVPSSTVQVNPPAVTTTEATGFAKVTVTRTGALTYPATVDFGTVDGSAKADSDYATTAGQLSFPAGVSSRTINVPILRDGSNESTESFALTIANPVGAQVALGTAATTTVTISSEASGDKTKPIILQVPLQTRSRTMNATYGIGSSYSSDEPVVAFHTLRLGTRVIGTKSSSLTKVGIAKPIIKLSTGGKAYVNSQFIKTRASRLTMTITSSYKDTAGNGLVISARAIVTR